jgi:hypothetical protein
VGPRADLDAVAKRRIMPCRESNPGHPVRSTVPIVSPFLFNCLLLFYKEISKGEKKNNLKGRNGIKNKNETDLQ